jgi:hypothetical protein
MLLNKLNKCLHKPRGLVSSFLTPVGYKGITSVKRNDSSTREPRDKKDDTSPCHVL